jgi:hypothetical protein
VEVRHDEGVANRIVPEPCIGGREVSGEASAGEGTGQPLSRDRNILGADAVEIAEGNMVEHANASARATRRGQRTWHVPRLLAREPGDLTSGRGSVVSVRIGKARSRSR